MKDQEVIELLLKTGHLKFPFGDRQEVPQDTFALTLAHPVIEKAVASYQDFMVECLDPLCLKHHGRPARSNGVSGPATAELFEISRCEYPDYGEEVRPRNVQAAIGSGSWKGCHDIGDYHAATMFIDTKNMPSFWEKILETVWGRFVAANAEIGMQWIRTDDRENANTTLSFTLGRKPWIGLAIVGSNESCSSKIWLQLLASYEPQDLVAMLTELLLHEGGHNMGLYHTRGGIMSATIVRGLPASWKGDPSESILHKLYGGVPIPDNRSDEYWVTQCYKSNRGREVCVPLFPPILVEN
ncbi:hypothetical protein LCGC14_0356930 [marine sediment metagenome]|uniref:Peptidase M10 metallopeptidase domain-containing protein n=1 Tax=marine sediment metagenome TaxID=412755 RepID=A0A0F9TEL9_9ZZZZ